ncbi:MAG: multidrug effflux MFS transporter [Paracoccaceae bacterium]
MTDTEERRGSTYLIAVMAGLTAIGPFSIDAYLPALPIMAETLEASDSLLKLTMSVYLLGIAFFPLILSPLSDAYGRKPVLSLALLGYALTSAACAMAPSAEALILCRFLQAAAGGVVMTVARVVVSDLYSGDALSRAMSQVMLMFTIAPVIAPIIGGALLEVAGWRAIFWALVVYGLIGFLLALTLSETLATDRRTPYNLTAFRQGYLEIARSKAARRYFYLTFWSAVFFFAMLTSAPYIYMDQFGFSPLQFGYVFAAISGAAFFANMLNARLVMRFGYGRMLSVTVLSFIGWSAAMGLVAVTGLGGPWGVLAVMIWLMGAFHILFSNIMAGVMHQVQNRAGALSAVLALFRFVGGAIGAAALGLFGSDQVMGFAVILGVSSVMMLVVAPRTLRRVEQIG